jgi:hypothetical protein
MKMLLEYLERAVELEKLASTEPNETFRTELLKQAWAYRELAAKRAEEYGRPKGAPQRAPTAMALRIRLDHCSLEIIEISTGVGLGNLGQGLARSAAFDRW